LRARGLHPSDALARTHRELEEHHQHQDRPAEPERDSLTPTQARGLLTRAWIRAPFDSEIISLKTADHYPRGGVLCSLASSLRMTVPLQTTTSRRSPPFTWCSAYVVVCRSWSRPSLARRPVFSQLATSPTSFPLEEPFSASHKESPPRTRSLCLAQEVSTSHEKSGSD
jgi:hypothetical protein